MLESNKDAMRLELTKIQTWRDNNHVQEKNSAPLTGGDQNMFANSSSIKQSLSAPQIRKLTNHE